MDALELVDIDYDLLPAVLDMEEALAGRAPTSCHGHLQSNQQLPLRVRRRRGRRGGRHRPGLRRRRRRRQPPVRAAAADPGVHGAARRRRASRRATTSRSGRSPRCRTSCGVMLAMVTGVPEHKLRVVAPDVGGGFGGKLQVTPEEILSPAGGPAAGQAGQVERDAQRVADERPPRPRPDPVHRHRRRPRGQRQGPALPDPLRHGRLPAAGHPGHPDPRRVHVRRHLQVPGLPLRVPRRLHQQDADRRLPRRRPAGGDLRRRADHGRARRRARHGPAGAAPQELDQGRGVPVHHRGRPAVRQRRLRRRHRRGAAAVRLRRAARRAAAPPGGERPGAARHRDLHLHRDVRPGALPGARLALLRRRRLGARLDPDAAHRQGRGGHRLQRRTARATRRRGASSSPTGSACRSRTSRCCTATPRSRRAAWTPTAPARWSSAGPRWSRPRRRWSPRPGKVAAHLLEADEDDLEFADGKFAVRGTPGSEVCDPGDRAGHLRRAQLPRGHGAVDRRRRDLRPGRTSPSRTARTSAPRRSTPRPGG